MPIAVIKQGLKVLCLWTLSSLLAKGIIVGVKNVSEGKNVFGKKVERKKTFVDWHGDIHMGKMDYQITD